MQTAAADLRTLQKYRKRTFYTFVKYKFYYEPHYTESSEVCKPVRKQKYKKTAFYKLTFVKSAGPQFIVCILYVIEPSPYCGSRTTTDSVRKPVGTPVQTALNE